MKRQFFATASLLLCVGGTVAWGASQGVSTISALIPCDLDGDGGCNIEDFRNLRGYIGECEEGDHWGELADMDHDGCVTMRDVQQFVAEAWSFDGDSDVDHDDLAILRRDMGQFVADSQCGARCDLDGDGRVTSGDARRLEVFCSRLHCARK
jgi:hypothetical protein